MRVVKSNLAQWRDVRKHFANESAKIDLQRYLQNREARYLKAGWAEHSRLNGPWQTAKIGRLMDLLLIAPKKKGRPADARRNVGIARKFLCLQAIEKIKVDLTKAHMRKYPASPVVEYAPISDRKLQEMIATDCLMTYGHVRNIVRETLKKLGKGGPQGALLLERTWR